MTAENNTMENLLSIAPVIPVLSIANADQAVPLARALVKGGLKVIEITLRTPSALDSIRSIAENVDDALVGAGTVLTDRDLELAKEAGARFAVSPGATPALLRAASQSGLPFLPGVATASEIMTALEQGFSTLKFFPAEAAGGRAMLKSLAGPFPAVKLCPTGGVREENLSAYLELGNVCAVGGTWMAPADLLMSESWDAIEALAARALRLAGK